MNWPEIREWVAIVVPAIVFMWAIGERMVRKSFATTESLLAVHKVLDDRAGEQEKKIVQLKHEIELLKKDLSALPTYEKMNKLGEAINKLDKHLTERDGKIEGLADKVDDLRETVRAMDDIVRQIK